jgi:hypothetical protein
MALDQPTGQPKPFDPKEFTAASQNHVVTFAKENVQPPSPLYIQRDDQLMLVAISALSTEIVTLTARMWLADDSRIITIQRTLKLGVVYSTFTDSIPLAEGYLVSLIVQPFAATQLGQTHINVYINRGVVSFPITLPGGLLIESYASQSDPCFWPNDAPRKPGDGIGSRRVVTSTPGAGVDPLFQVDSGALWEPLHLFGTFTASAGVATRSPQLRIRTNGVTTTYLSSGSGSVVATQVAQVSACQNTPPVPILPLDIALLIPPRLMMVNADDISVVTVNIQGGDQWTNAALLVREWTVVI